MGIPKCSECEFRKQVICVGSIRPYYECTSPNLKVFARGHDVIICCGDKLPKTSPRWCPKRKKKTNKES